MIGTSRREMGKRVTQLLLYGSALVLVTAEAASLKDKPAQGVTLNGTEWRIDPYRSDDPDQVIERAQREKEEHDRNSRSGGMDRDVFGGGRDGPIGGGPIGGEDNHGTWGGGAPFPGRSDGGEFPDGGARPGGTLPRDTRGGGYGHDTGRSSTDIDPTGSSASASIQLGNLGGIRNEFVGQLTRNPDTLAFREVNQRVAVSEDKLETECAAGSKEPISDSFGDGERRCGWDKRAWVVETTRGKHFSRTDRYELSKDGKTLTYVTNASGAGMPSVKIRRVYTLAPKQPAD
ncbi:MAG TPA: hypothetical protein VG994_08420 [Steroidobacteraceae bacterium]|nr:hypothetical protein [Steroidobacteraceae bacterium]